MNFDLLCEVLNEGLFQMISSGKDKVVLQEKAKDAKLKKVVLKGVECDSLLLKMDKIRLNSIFKKGKGQGQRCDYILLTEHKSRQYAVGKRIYTAF